MFDNKNEGMQGKERLLGELEANNPGITSAIFDSYPMYPKDVERLLNIIKINTHLLTLSFLDCQFSKEETEALAKAILENNRLQEVKLELFMDDTPVLKTLMERVNLHLQNNAGNSATLQL